MIIYDFSNIVVGAAMEYYNTTGIQADLPLLRHLALNAIISDKVKKQQYLGSLGVVLAFDGRGYWRKQIFPYYKASRAKAKEESKFNFDAFYKDFNQMKAEFKEFLPYRCIEVEHAEADDVIAALVEKYSAHETICIVGADKDFLQIQEWNTTHKVVQWSPWHKKFLTPENTDKSLIEHICGGDKGDGIPYILSDEKSFVDGIRQRPFTKKLKEQVRQAGFAGISSVLRDANELERFKLNRELIDLKMIPSYIKDAIYEEFDKAEPVQGMFFKYCTDNKLMKILERAQV